MNFPGKCVTDAVGWPETITVEETYNYTSADGLIAITGTATFPYSRSTLDDALSNPRLLYVGGIEPDNQTFIPVQCGIGKMPGWVVYFGSQPTQQGVFTRTQTAPGVDPPPPVVTHLDADCAVTMTCAPCAPERIADTNLDGGPNGQIGINFGLASDDPEDDAGDYAQVIDAPYMVELLSTGFAADPATRRAAIGPVYLVTIPDDVMYVDPNGLNAIVNGATTELPYGPQSAFVRDVLLSAFGGNSDHAGIGMAFPRSPWICEVQMPNFGDTLLAGTITYSRSRKLDSNITFAGLSQTIDNPFPMTGQSFTAGDSTTGFTAKIQF